MADINMTREEAIKVLEESKRQNEVMRDNPNTFYKTSDIVDGMKNAQKRIDAIQMAISALREQEERRWIPVTERLPEQGERVLATDGGFVGELYVNSRGQWKRYNVNDHSLLMALDILWWMPMPQPPKEVPENETL